MAQENPTPPTNNFRHKLHTIIYEADTPAGKLFDLILIALILISVIAVMLESMAAVRIIYGDTLDVIEWVVTIFFTLEYIGRLIALRQPLRYVFSFYGIVDFLATVPMYIGLLFPGSGFLIAIRAIRLLRIFRILKLAHFVGASNQLTDAIKKSRAKIAVFVFGVVVLCIIMGTIMYLVEGPEHGFTSIPMSVYWAVVTLTTVGFGDITPSTPLGQFISIVIMIMGYGIIAVPTGLVTAQMITNKVDTNTQTCPNCGRYNHRDDARYCYNCGAHL
jgi:voltage-gated potassium channel